GDSALSRQLSNIAVASQLAPHMPDANTGYFLPFTPTQLLGVKQVSQRVCSLYRVVAHVIMYWVVAHAKRTGADVHRETRRDLLPGSNRTAQRLESLRGRQSPI